MNNTNQNTNQNKELGALWKKKSKAGMSFLSGYINDHDGQRIDVVVFANGKKTNEKAPDYRMYVSKPLNKEGVATTNSTPATTSNVTASKAPVKTFTNKAPVSVVEEDQDDIL